jgi:hypothetical protein
MDFYYKYITYKKKYIQLKNKINQSNHMIGGNILETQSESKLDKLRSYDTADDMLEYIKEHNIPVMFLPDDDNIMEFKNSLTNTNELYSMREKIYTLDIKNRDEILDYIIEHFKINNIMDITKLFESTILGYNMNYVIYYMVLLRYLIKNNIQLNTFDTKLSFMTQRSLEMGLNFANNDEEYLSLILSMIKSYIFQFPIKKILQIRKEEVDWYKNKRSLRLNKKETDHMTSYDAKNNIFIYSSGIIKDSVKIEYSDIIMILASLFTIKIFSPKN